MEIDRIGIHHSVDSVFPAEQLRDYLADIEPDVVVVGDDADVLTSCDALVTIAYAELFLEAGLQWIHSIQAGVDRFPFDEFDARNIALTSSVGIHGDWVGETVAGYMLMFARRLHRHVLNQRDHTWQRPPWNEPFTLGDRSICVVGLGTLGRNIAARAAGLGMHVMGVKRTVEAVEHVDTVHPVDDLVGAISEAAFVALAVPLTDETHHLIGSHELAAMREDAYLINVARGPVIDDSALIDAIQDGEIAGAALDVFDEEPLSEDSPLWDLDDVIISPHIAGVSSEYYQRVGDIVRGNLRRDATGESLTNRVV